MSFLGKMFLGIAPWQGHCHFHDSPHIGTFGLFAKPNWNFEPSGADTNRAPKNRTLWFSRAVERALVRWRPKNKFVDLNVCLGNGFLASAKQRGTAASGIFGSPCSNVDFLKNDVIDMANYQEHSELNYSGQSQHNSMTLC